MRQKNLVAPIFLSELSAIESPSGDLWHESCLHDMKLRGGAYESDVSKNRVEQENNQLAVAKLFATLISEDFRYSMNSIIIQAPSACDSNSDQVPNSTVNIRQPSPSRRQFMSANHQFQPTEVELQMLRILWELGPSPVREIHSRLNEAKGTNYSTTVKMLSVMLEKGLVRRDEEVSPHVYRAAVSRDSAGKRLVKDLVEKVYDGAAMSLVLHALKSTKASPEELAEIRQLLDQMEDKP